MRIDYGSFRYKYKRPPKGQFPALIRVYKGQQGAGKTLSMVHDFLEVIEKYPDCERYGNIDIHGVENYHLIRTDEDLDAALARDNGTRGVLLLLDEAHNYFGKKTGISWQSLMQITQNRKTRRMLYMSSQIWEDLDVSMRKQVDEIARCRSIFGFLQLNTIFNGHSIRWSNLDSDWVADKMYTTIFKHSQPLYDCYDTFQKIIRNTDLHQLTYSTNTRFKINLNENKRNKK